MSDYDTMPDFRWVLFLFSYDYTIHKLRQRLLFANFTVRCVQYHRQTVKTSSGILYKTEGLRHVNIVAEQANCSNMKVEQRTEA